MLRWLPVLIAFCLAATLYVFILTEPFRICVAILGIQWVANVLAMAIVFFALSSILRFVRPAPSPDRPIRPTRPSRRLPSRRFRPRCGRRHGPDVAVVNAAPEQGQG